MYAKEDSSHMTTLVRWDPFREVAAVHNELSRLMNGLYEGNGRATQTWVPVGFRYTSNRVPRSSSSVSELMTLNGRAES